MKSKYTNVENEPRFILNLVFNGAFFEAEEDVYSTMLNFEKELCACIILLITRVSK